MRLRRQASVALLAAAAAVTVLAPIQSSAAAATAAGNAALRPQGNAPSCVSVWERVGTITKTGYAKNNCGYQMNLKIVWAHGADGPCRTVPNGSTLSHKVPRGPRTFDGANRC